MKTIKKACKGTLYPKSSSVSRKLKKGGSFDLNKDGKTTFKDVLIGRGVLPKTAKKGMKVKKAQTGETLPGVTVNSKAEPKKPLLQKIFGTPEERADRKLERQNNREDRKANRQANRADRQARRSCVSTGRCGGRGMGFGGYNKNGGTTKKAKTGTKVSKSTKKK